MGGGLKSHSVGIYSRVFASGSCCMVVVEPALVRLGSMSEMNTGSGGLDPLEWRCCLGWLYGEVYVLGG